MYKLLVVDDEQLAREDILYKVGRSGFRFDWIMEASSAEEAVEMIQVNRPDIMLTDIMMGEMNGLDLIGEANRYAPKMISVIICGYPDFSFAQRAVELGAMQYLLKPVNGAELSAVLARVTQELHRKKEQSVLSTDNYALQRRLENYRLRDMVNAFVNGTAQGENREILGLLPKDCKWFQAWNVQLQDWETQYSRSKSGETGLLYGLCNIVREIGGELMVPVEGAEEGLMTLVLVGCRRQKLEEAEGELNTLAHRLCPLLSEKLCVGVSMGVSTIRDTLRADIVLEARMSADVRLYYESKSIQVLRYDKLIQASEDGSYDADRKALKKFIADGDLKNSGDIVAKIFKKYEEAPILGIRNAYVDMIGMFSRACYKKGISILGFLGYENISGSILNSFTSVRQVTENLQFILRMSLVSWVRHMEDTADVLEKIKGHIEESFADSELSTTKLGKLFCISTGYLSASYKKSYGITISKFIIAKRMEYAAKLLKDTGLSVNDISESSGFNNISYFMRVFKSYYGLTPSQYRAEPRI